jgi:hypothetical protein
MEKELLVVVVSLGKPIYREGDIGVYALTLHLAKSYLYVVYNFSFLAYEVGDHEEILNLLFILDEGVRLN